MAVRNRGLAALALFALLAVAHTWPLALAPATTGRTDNADTLLNAWILAWVPHALVTQPLHLFDANIFFPAGDTLAFSEHLFAPAILGAPLTWAGAPPLLVHNLVLIAGLAFTGWAWCVLGWRWTRDPFAAVFVGTVAAFNTHTLTRLPHVQAMHVEFLPFALLALDHLISERGTRRQAAGLAAGFASQALCSGYLLVLSALSLVVTALARIGEWARPGRAARFIVLSGAAAVASVLALTPFLLPYLRVQRAEGLTRSLEEVALYSAAPSSYLSTAARLHQALWAGDVYSSSDALFPGVAVLALAAWAVVRGVAWRDARARAMLAVAIVSFAASLGPHLPGYATAWAWIPLLQGIRSVSRFGYLVIVGLAVVAGIGLAHARRALQPSPLLTDGVACPPAGGRRAALALGVAAVIVAQLDAWRAPIGLTTYEGVPRIYSALADERDAVVAEIPFPIPERVDRNATAVIGSTRHWKPLLNGYSGFTPASYIEHARVLRDFPDARSWAMLRDVGVTHLVVRADGFDEATLAVILQDPRVRVLARDPRLLILRVHP